MALPICGGRGYILRGGASSKWEARGESGGGRWLVELFTTAPCTTLMGVVCLAPIPLVLMPGEGRHVACGIAERLREAGVDRAESEDAKKVAEALLWDCASSIKIERSQVGVERDVDRVPSVANGRKGGRANLRVLLPRREG